MRICCSDRLARRGILVAVVETQDIFVDHEDLHDSVFENDNEVPDDGIDNDHNGCVDDVRGCDLRDDSGYVGPSTTTTVRTSPASSPPASATGKAS